MAKDIKKHKNDLSKIFKSVSFFCIFLNSTNIQETWLYSMADIFNI